MDAGQASGKSVLEVGTEADTGARGGHAGGRTNPLPLIPAGARPDVTGRATAKGGE